MTPSEKIRVQECVRELAGIFYRNTSPDKCQTFEEIEQVVREHLLESVGLDLALFLSKKNQNPKRKRASNQEFCRKITFTPSATGKIRSRTEKLYQSFVAKMLFMSECQ